MVSKEGFEELYEELIEKYADEILEIREIEWEMRPAVFDYIIDDRNKRLITELLDSASSPNTSADA